VVCQQISQLVLLAPAGLIPPNRLPPTVAWVKSLHQSCVRRLGE
jgi:hypothetical protein